jgi:CheY-like chemotaxis protein
MTAIRTVLIVDDDPFIRRLVATTLEDVAGFEIHQAADGLEAIQMAVKVTPSIVFLDLDMPRLNGIEACRRLREIDSSRSATIVMLTASGASESADEAKRAGVDLFLTKPFSPLDLLRLVDQLGPA